MRPIVAVMAVLGLVTAGLVTSAPSAEAVTTSRIAGADRFETAIEVSRSSPHGGVLYLASGLSFPDALAAGPVAAAEGAHLLLTRPDRVDPSVIARMQELQPRLVVLVGSEATVQDAVRAQVAAALPNAALERVGGRDRVETSMLLLDRLAGLVDISEVWVVSGHGFPDALVAASVAGATAGGILLDWHGGSTSDARAWGERIASRVAGRPVSIAGGTPSVSAADERLLPELGAIDVIRYAGADRYDTARLVNDAYPVERGASMVLATGENFPDALSGAVHAAHTGRPLFLSPSVCHPTISGMLAAEAAERGITHIIGLGSAASLSDRALSLGPCMTPTQQALGASFGTFPAFTREGTGAATIALPSRVIGAVVQVRWSPGTTWDSYTLTVSTTDRGPQEIAQARKAGTETYFAGLDRAGSATLTIATQGSWRITVMDASGVPMLPTAATGSGSAVYAFEGPAATLTFQRPEPWLGFWVSQASVRHGLLHRQQLHGPTSSTISAPAVGELSLIIVAADEPWNLSVR